MYLPMILILKSAALDLVVFVKKAQKPVVGLHTWKAFFRLRASLASSSSPLLKANSARFNHSSCAKEIGCARKGRQWLQQMKYHCPHMQLFIVWIYKVLNAYEVTNLWIKKNFPTGIYFCIINMMDWERLHSYCVGCFCIGRNWDLAGAMTLLQFFSCWNRI